jgi:hypothetical protein
MACINLATIENLLIWLVVIGAVIALVRLLLPLVLGQLGVAATTIVAALQIVIWALVAIFVIIVVFELISCLLGVGMRLR